MTLLYIDCVSGVAGDMLMAALIHAGASVDGINSSLAGLSIPGLTVSTEPRERHGVSCLGVNVSWEQPEPASTERQHAHRPYAHIRSLLERADLAPKVRQRSQSVFARLAGAEARIHGVPLDEVTFHEVGSEDAIADVVGVVMALELLGVSEVRCSPLPLGRGTVRAAHGVLPLPAPATLELLKGIPVIGSDINKELVTPTGAALIAELASSFGGFPAMSISAIGYGGGGRDLAEQPNIVRVVLGSQSHSLAFGEVVLLETNLDDCLPEIVPDIVNAATDAGALDVWTSPAGMKKGRPGFVVHALARDAQVDAVTTALLRESTSLGVRMCTYQRVELERTFIEVDVDGQPIKVKVGSRYGIVMNVSPEHDDCAVAAQRVNKSVKEVFARALGAAYITLDPRPDLIQTSSSARWSASPPSPMDTPI